MKAVGEQWPRSGRAGVTAQADARLEQRQGISQLSMISSGRSCHSRVSVPAAAPTSDNRCTHLVLSSTWILSTYGHGGSSASL